MSRQEELIELVGDGNAKKACCLIDEIVYLEGQLKELRKLPMIKVDPNNPLHQKQTPAAKTYREMLSQYNNALRLLLRITGDLGNSEEESPLRKWLREQNEMDG